MTILLHHVPQARSFRVLWMLHEIGLAHVVVRHSFFDKSLRDPAFRALSPAGRVPALEIDGRVLFESGAILEYLAETRAPDLYRAPGHSDRADWLEWLHYGETAAAHLANLTQHHIALREDHMRSPTVMRLEARRLDLVLTAAARARRGAYLLGDFTACDIAVGYALVIGQRFVRFADPAVADWLAALQARPAYQAALAADGPPELYTRDFYEAPDG